MIIVFRRFTRIGLNFTRLRRINRGKRFTLVRYAHGYNNVTRIAYSFIRYWNSRRFGFFDILKSVNEKTLRAEKKNGRIKPEKCAPCMRPEEQKRHYQRSLTTLRCENVSRSRRVASLLICRNVRKRNFHRTVFTILRNVKLLEFNKNHHLNIDNAGLWTASIYKRV